MLFNILSFIAGAVVGIFFYRNNQAKVSKVADKVDDIVEDVKEATKK
jgi:hypothetical protein